MVRFTLTLSAVLITGSAYADVYKTVDAQGQVHYSDQWSPGAEVIKTNQSARALEANQAAAPPSAPPSTDPQQAAQKAVAADVAAVHADDCKKLQDAYDKEIRARRIIKPGSTADNPDFMTDAEADAERVKTKQAMDEACGGTPST